LSLALLAPVDVVVEPRIVLGGVCAKISHWRLAARTSGHTLPHGRLLLLLLLLLLLDGRSLTTGCVQRFLYRFESFGIGKQLISTMLQKLGVDAIPLLPSFPR